MVKLRVIERTFSSLSAARAADMLGLSPRQVFRLKAQVRTQGPKGLVHGNTGRIPAIAKPRQLHTKVTSLYRREFHDYNIAHFTETLADEYGIELGYETVRDWLRNAGLGPPRRESTTHRRRRERRAQFGEMLFLDGSPHPWFGENRPKLTLILATDDATGKPLYGLFESQETLNGCFEALYHVFCLHGLPGVLYLDRASQFTTTRHGGVHRFQRDDKPTHFEIAMQRLTVDLIFADSPQARGRGERINGSFQGRLVAEFRRRGITKPEPATAYLNDVFIPKYARRFGVQPRSPDPAFRTVPKGVDLHTVLCTKARRTVGNDDTISYRGHTYQLLLGKRAPCLFGAKVEVQKWFDDSVHVSYPGVGAIRVRELGQ